MKEENALHRTNPEFLTVPAQTPRASDLLLARLRPAARRVRVERSFPRAGLRGAALSGHP